MESSKNIARRFSVGTAPPSVMAVDENHVLLLQQQEDLRKKKLFVSSSLIAGFGSGALASIACAPMDLLRTRMQVMGAFVSEAKRRSVYGHLFSHLRQIIQTEGPAGCFRGLGATLATVPTFWAIYFPLYEEFKVVIPKIYNNTHDNINHPFIHLTSAIIAGAAADVVCNPMFVVRTRMQTETLHFLEQQIPSASTPSMMKHRHVPTIGETIASIYAEGGLSAFWRGLTASLIGLSHVAIQFPVYEFLKAEARSRNYDGKERPIDLLLASGLSKICGSLVSYPHEVLRSRMMDARGVEAGKSLIKVMRQVISAEGYVGLYRGLTLSLIRVLPNCCVTFTTYELFMRWSKDNLSAILLNCTTKNTS
jgi:solute carrier family 25 folate transporter 32